MFRSISKQHVMFKKKATCQYEMSNEKTASFFVLVLTFLVFQTGKEYVEDDTRVESITTST